jgi:DNA binding domain, excisionase family
VPSLPSPWLTVGEAVDYAKRSKNTLNCALRAGELRGSQTKRGGIWLIHRDDLDAWIRGEIAPAEPPRITRPRRTPVAS